jgi:hypothetical protein
MTKAVASSEALQARRGVEKNELGAGRCAVEYGKSEGPFDRATGGGIRVVHRIQFGGSVELHYSSCFNAGERKWGGEGLMGRRLHGTGGGSSKWVA